MLIFTYLLIPLISFTQVHKKPSEQLVSTIKEFNNSSDKKAYIEQNNSYKDINVLKYILANQTKTTHPQKSCKIFTELTKTSNFTFKDLAELRAFETCKNKELSINLKKWLQKSFRQIEFEKCANIDSKKCIDLYINKSKQKISQQEKIAYIEVAIAKASNLNKPNLMSALKKRLEKISPKYKDKIEKKDYLSVANDFLKSRNFNKAEKYFNKIINQNFGISTKVKAMKGLSKSRKLQRKYKEYVLQEEKLFTYVLSTYKKDKRLISNGLMNSTCQSYSRAAWSYTSRASAENTIKTCVKLLNKKHSLAALHWIKGRIEEEKKDYKSAIYYFDQSLKEKIKHLEFKEKLLWYKAWNQRKLGQKQNSLKTIQKLINITKNRFSKAKFMFWKAKIKNELKQTNDANIIFNKIISEYPLSYYSLLSHKFVNKKLRYNKAKANSFSSTKNLKNKLNLNYLDWLLLIEEKEFAQNFLKQQVSRYRKSFKEGDIKLVSDYYAKTNLYLEYFYLVSILSPDRQNNIVKHNPELLFPQPYKKIVNEQSHQLTFSSEIVYSIMRQESAFNTNARSFADAFGLMQLIPEVALKANKKVQSSYKQASDLFDPQLNIKLGSFYLKQQWNIYENQFILATASYNATDKAIRSWIKTRFNGDTLQFIEDIPYEETRNYVKLVMRNYVYYKLINSNGEIDFPEYCLNIKGT